MKKFIPFIVIAGIVAVAWYVLKGKKIPTAATTATEAQAIINDPTSAIASYRAYEEKHPSSGDILDQVEAHLTGGTAHVEDIIRFQTELNVYAQYTAAGGTSTFEQFMITDYSSMPAVYKDQILAAKAAATSYAADELLSGYLVTDAYGQVLDIRMEDLKEYVARHSLTSPIIQELISRYPELAPETATKEAVALEAPEVAETAAPPPEPEPFTATVEQLDQLAAEVGAISTEYQESIDTAFEAVAAQAASTGDYVGYTSEGGYEVVSSDEMYNPAYM